MVCRDTKIKLVYSERSLLFAQKNKNAAPVAATATDAPKKEAKKTIKEIIKPTKLSDGLFAMYQDTAIGTVYMKIKKEQLNKDKIAAAAILQKYP